LKVGVVLNAKQLRIELARVDRIDLSDDSSEDRVVILIQTGEQVRDQFIIMEWSFR
jgi:hypothetical protein